MRHNAIGDLHPDALVLASKLREAAEGQTLSYSDLSAAIGGNVQGEARARLVRARAIVQRENGIVFATVANEGIKRLDATGIVHQAPDTRERARKMFRREMGRLRVAKYDDLSDADKLRWNAEMSHAGALYAFTTNKTADKLKARIAELTTPSVLPLASTLDVFRNGKGNGKEITKP